MPETDDFQAIRYTLDTPSDSLAARFQRDVMLLPFFGVTPADEAVRRVEQVLGVWRRRVHRLREWGDGPTRMRPRRRLGGMDRATLERRVRRQHPDASRSERRQLMAEEVELEARKCHGVYPRSARMFNCPPVAARYAPDGPPCRVPRLCPFCWTRRASEIYGRIDRLLFPGSPLPEEARVADGGRGLDFDEDEAPPPPKPRPKPRRSGRLRGRALVLRTLTIVKDVEEWPVELARLLAHRLDPASDRRKRIHLPTREVDSARLRAAGATGVLDATRVDLGYGQDPEHPRLYRAEEGRGPATTWRVTISQVILCDDPEAITGNRLLADAPKVRPDGEIDAIAEPIRFRAVADPTRADLMRMCAQALRCPKALMTMPREETRLYLKATEGRRLTATYGSFRGGSDGED